MDVNGLANNRFGVASAIRASIVLALRQRVRGLARRPRTLRRHQSAARRWRTTT
jgi:hypothetical protein